MQIRKTSILVYIVAFLTAVSPVTTDGAGLPGEFQSTSWWHSLHLKYSALNNPAFLTEEDYVTARLVQALLQGTEFSLTETGVTLPIGWTQSAGFSVVSQNSGPVDEYVWENGTTDNPTYRTNGTTDFGINDFILSYAINPLSRLSLGGNFHVLYMNLFDDRHEIGFQLDAGVSWRLMLHPVLGRHLIGMSLSNILPGTVENRFVSSTGHLFYMGTILDEQIEIIFHATARDLLYSEEQYLKEKLLREWEVNPQITWFFLRNFDVSLTGGYNNDGPSFAAPSLGFNFPGINSGRDLRMQYQFTWSLTENVTPSHSVYLRAEMGPSRGDRFASNRIMAVALEPSRLYNLGRKLYSEGKFWDAFFVLSRIPVEYPQFIKNDRVSLLQASCLEELDMREAAESGYNHIRQKYPNSPVVGNALLGEMRLLYREDDRTAIVTKYSELLKSDAPDSLRHHGTYLLGEVFMKRRKYREAMTRFAGIPSDHPDYPFAVYSLAIAEILVNNNMEKAIENLSVCVSVTPSTEAQAQIKDRAMLTLGLIFYEQNSMANAIIALREVHPQSLYYEDAQLGITWVALKNRQWDDCIQAATTLRKISRKPVIGIEAALTEAYAYIMKKKYAQAAAILQKASENAGKISSQKQKQELLDKKERLSSDRLNYNEIARSMTSLSRSRRSETVSGIIDSLEHEQRDTWRKINSYYAFKFSYDKTSIFMKNFEQLRKDVEFALVKAESLTRKYEQEKDIIKAKQKEQAIEEEIDRLRQKLDDQNTVKDSTSSE